MSTKNAYSQSVFYLGMGELHLEIYLERMRREYNVDCITGNPSVSPSLFLFSFIIAVLTLFISLLRNYCR
ncbi:hypothetical protein EON65_23055 [archaeon]|nr:MAG: hypothetical protein EON65_23055 [archaeon]